MACDDYGSQRREEILPEIEEAKPKKRPAKKVSKVREEAPKTAPKANYSRYGEPRQSC